MRSTPILLSILVPAVVTVAALPGAGAAEPEAGAAAPPAQPADDVEALVATALAENPELTSISAQVRALEQRERRARAWSDPRLTLSYQNVPITDPVLGQEPMSMASVRLEQTIPWFGKTAKRGAVVAEAAEGKRWSLAERKVKLRALVRDTYYRLGLSRQLAAITRKHIGLVDQLLDAVRVKYEVGRAEQHSVLRLQVLRDRLTDDLENYTRADRELTAALNAALHRPPETPIRTPASFDLAAPGVTAEQLMKLARRHRPALKQLASQALMHRLSARLDRAEATPDVTVFAGYGLRTDLPSGAGGRDLVTVGISVPLPLFRGSRYEAPARAEMELARSADADRDALTDQIASGIADGLATWQRAAGEVETYRDKLVPGAQHTLDATLSSYQVDRAQFTTLYDAEVELLDFERTIRKATVAGLIAAAKVEMLVGKELP